MRPFFASLIALVLSLGTSSAWAVSSVSITADEINIHKIENQPVSLRQVSIALDLNAKETLLVKANTAHFQQALVNKAEAWIDLTGRKPAQIKAEHIEYQQFEARKTWLHLDLLGNTRADFSTDVKQKSDKLWAQAKLNCLVPKNLETELWQCESGQYQSDRIHLPFSLNLSPQSNGFNADFTLKEANFSDEAGLHAAEKLSGNLHLKVQKTGDYYRWQSTLQWENGEMFWQPFYFSGSGHQFSATGILQPDSVIFENAKLNIQKVGELNFKGKMRLKDYHLTSFDAEMPTLNLNEAYPLIFKPLLEKTAFNNADIDGNAALKVSMREGEIKSFELQLRDVNIDDKNKKFAFYHINADLPWSYDDAKKVSFAYQSGLLLNLPLGETNMTAEVNRYALTSPSITLPILDGALQLTDISAAHIGAEWFWHLQAKLKPISMADFSRALKLPVMYGWASAEIPMVTYSGGNLTADGEIVLNVFDGTANITNLTMKNPLGVAPKLNADIALRNLDLGSLTRTYSFGGIEGKLDGDIDDLELQSWKTVKFDAQVHSSAGKYPKKISQRAVENISALGGAGAAAAIQRSFLQFFKQFNYEKMGLSCKLRNDVCEMGGIESTPHGYVIVKGSGIPQITVMGYNHTVGWGELLARIKRVTDGNSKAIVK
ncbi:MAG TPA: hypothetical protein PL131_04615 [Methylotenera sp.]|nr:hypothetical protein [Methylotenera sp.]HPH05137.1 hypothetical protein [Methylotenera sp.]HPN00501.1 hypothetical protein [Methylotenera sp.]